MADYIREIADLFIRSKMPMTESLQILMKLAVFNTKSLMLTKDQFLELAAACWDDNSTPTKDAIITQILLKKRILKGNE